MQCPDCGENVVLEIKKGMKDGWYYASTKKFPSKAMAYGTCVLCGAYIEFIDYDGGKIPQENPDLNYTIICY